MESNSTLIGSPKFHIADLKRFFARRIGICYSNVGRVALQNTGGRAVRIKVANDTKISLRKVNGVADEICSCREIEDGSVWTRGDKRLEFLSIIGRAVPHYSIFCYIKPAVKGRPGRIYDIGPAVT